MGYSDFNVGAADHLNGDFMKCMLHVMKARRYNEGMFGPGDASLSEIA